MNVLVTGGAGYIGSVLVDRLITEGHKVKIIDDLSNGFTENIHKNAVLFEGSILDNDILTKAIEGVEVVFHLAAKIRVAEGESEPDLYKKVNIDGSLNLLKLCQKKGIKKFIFASTAAVYGDSKDYPITEKSKEAPVNVYGQTKLEIDRYLFENAQLLGISSISFRFFNVGGALKNSDVNPLLINGTDWPTSDGTPVRDFVHVTDLVDALVKSLAHLEKVGHTIINIGTATGSTVLQVVVAAESVLGRKIHYKFSERRAGDCFALVSSNEAAKIVLGWKPTKSLKEILKDANSELTANN